MLAPPWAAHMPWPQVSMKLRASQLVLVRSWVLLRTGHWRLLTPAMGTKTSVWGRGLLLRLRASMGVSQGQRNQEGFL